jgi:hypothetical protein
VEDCSSLKKAAKKYLKAEREFLTEMSKCGVYLG